MKIDEKGSISGPREAWETHTVRGQTKSLPPSLWERLLHLGFEYIHIFTYIRVGVFTYLAFFVAAVSDKYKS